MTWAKVDDKLYAHPKWLATPARARGLWVTALSWCMDHLTDGTVPAHALPLLAAKKADADALVKVGLWEQTSDGYRFRDWSDYQPDAASIKAKREGESEGGLFGNHIRWHAKRRQKVPGCEWCESGEASATRSGTRSGPRSGRGESGANPPVPVPSSSHLSAGTYESSNDDAAPQLETSIPKHVLPASWTPSTAHKAYALEHGLDLKHEVQTFRANRRSRRLTSFDWDADFDGWLANAVRINTERAARSGDAPRPGASAWANDVTGKGARP